MRVAVALIGLLCACKGDPVKCDQGCRNFAALAYWKDADAAIAASPADQRDALRKQSLVKFDGVLERGIDLCVSQCQSAGNTAQIDCMVAAKTADQAYDCFK